MQLLLQNQTTKTMKLTSETNLTLNPLLTKINPWIGLFVSLIIVIPNLYEVIGNEFTVTSSHLSLGGGLFFFIIFLIQIFDQIILLENMK